MTNPWVCIECGGRQAEPGTCRACRKDEVLDANKEEVRGLMADVELRLGDRREARLRWGGVILAISIVVFAWTIPGYWQVRGDAYPGLPFLLDQWLFMTVLGFGFLKLGERVFTHKRFPYLNEQQQLIDG